MEDRQRYSLDVDQIQEFLPHRPPFLMVDRILEIHPRGPQDTLSGEGKEGTRVVGVKSVSINEPHMAGHFPGFAIMPGVLILEAMAQVSAFSLYPPVENEPSRFRTGYSVIFAGANKARWRAPVVPGDLLKIETEVKKVKKFLWVFECAAKVEGKTVAEAEIMASLQQKDQAWSL